ncbi:efflux transporter outer membrane subunit [Derxia gummosa]|uniref:Efflux transporter outer membrane subunit n=1 Tax=Derxia gummosa DSM 723 TaxID=1121388 RepID=A0A8B6X9C9_9BURK|nr:efflux transporter outer membrane subunit [Derxia gummosa]
MTRAACLARPLGAALALACVALAGCAGAPTAVVPPTLPVAPASWQSPLPWTPAAPAAAASRGAWWRVFDDATLDALVARGQRDNPGLAVLAARLRQAGAASAFAGAATLPRLDASARATRQRSSANRPGGSYGATLSSTTQNDHALGLAASWEVDLFGRIDNEIAAARATEAQTAADLAAARLVLAADIAASYFTLRQIDAELAVLAQSIEAQRRAVALLDTRHAGGAASGLDLAQQQAQLDATRTTIDLLRRQRPLVEHALASLVGATPGEALVAARPAADATAASIGADAPATALLPAAPPLPLALPSEVLQRRPDITAAQQAVAAANAQLGIAGAGFYPSLVLGASGGLDSRALAALLDAPSLLWSVGASVAQTVFDGGRNRARVESARAGQDAAGASYRAVVLRAVQEVEDGLAGLDGLGRAAASADAASASADRALAIAQAREAGGLATWLDVLTARQRALDARRQAVQIRGQQLVGTAALVKALGGGWDAAANATALASPESLPASQAD